MTSLEQLQRDRPGEDGWSASCWTDWRWSRFLSRHGRVALFGAELPVDRSGTSPARPGAIAGER